MEIVKMKLVILLIILYVKQTDAVYNEGPHLRYSTTKNAITFTSMGSDGQALANIERRLSLLESDNRRLTIENQQIHRTNIDLKQEIQQVKTVNHKIKKSVRRLEIEKRHFMQVVGDIQEKIRLLVEDQDQQEFTASQDISRHNVPYSDPKPVSSSIQQAERKLSSDRDGMHDYPGKFNPDVNPVNDLRNMLVQSKKNESVTSVFLPRPAKRESRKNARVASPTTAVAFHTSLSTELTNPADGQIIVMSNVLTNEGAAYDSSTGYFTCPESGVYVFFVTTLTLPNKHIETQLVKNGQPIGVLISGSSDNYGSSSNMVIVTAQKGDHVWVRVNDHYHDSGTVLHQTFTTFSGFLLH